MWPQPWPYRVSQYYTKILILVTVHIQIYFKSTGLLFRILHQRKDCITSNHFIVSKIVTRAGFSCHFHKFWLNSCHPPAWKISSLAEVLKSMMNVDLYPQLSLFKWTASVSLTSVQNKVCLLMKNSPRATFCSHWLCKCEDDLLFSFPKLALCWKQEHYSVNASLLVNLYKRYGCPLNLVGVSWQDFLEIESNYLSRGTAKFATKILWALYHSAKIPLCIF